jgi:hypothetical protein
MFINIAQIKTKKGVKNGLRYQMKNGRGEILTGSPEMVQNWAATSNSESVKAFSILITFKESKAELEAKLKKQGYALEELFEDIERLIFAGYQREELSYTMIAHADTDHYHIHTYLSNNYAGTGKTIRFWFNENDLTAIKQFISLKYDLDINPTPKAGRTRKVGSSHWKGEAKKREEIKDSIHETIMEDVIDGKITNNSQVRERLKLITELTGVSLKEYKNAISIVKSDGYKITLKNGIYRENWMAAQNIKVKEVLDGLIGYLERRLKETERYKKDRQKRKSEQPEYKTEILGESFLTFLKKIKQNQNQQQKQPQQKQPQNQSQPQTQQLQKQPANQKQPAIDNQTAREDYQQEQYYLQEGYYTPRMKM